MHKRLITIAALLVGVLAALPNFVRAEDDITVLNKQIADRKDKIKQLEQTINTYNKNIVQKETEAVSLKNQISILDNHIAAAQADIELTDERIKETNLEIEALQISIYAKQKDIDRQKIILGRLVRDIDSGDHKGYVEILATYKNFSEFYNEVTYVSNVYSDLGHSVKALRVAKEELDNKKSQVQAKQNMLVDLKKELEAKHEALTSQSTAKQNILVQTKASEAKFKTLLSDLKQQYQVIENEQRTFEAELRKKLEAQDKISDSNDDLLFAWPVPSHVINATFHDPDYPYKGVFQHSGIDIKAAFGTPVRAVSSGYVARARTCTTASCYAYVLIVHTGTLSSLYGHLSKIMVSEDQFVNRGDIIGYSGGTPGTVGAGPFVTGPHLHFEARLNGIPVNPMPYMVQ